MLVVSQTLLRFLLLIRHFKMVHGLLRMFRGLLGMPHVTMLDCLVKMRCRFGYMRI